MLHLSVGFVVAAVHYKASTVCATSTYFSDRAVSYCSTVLPGAVHVHRVPDTCSACLNPCAARHNHDRHGRRPLDWQYISAVSHKLYNSRGATVTDVPAAAAVEAVAPLAIGWQPG